MQASFQIGRHFFARKQMVCDILGGGEGLSHVLLLQVFRQLQGCLNVCVLTALVTASQKNHEILAPLRVSSGWSFIQLRQTLWRSHIYPQALVQRSGHQTLVHGASQ